MKILKWSDYTYSDSDFYIPYDENQKAIRGYLLTTLGINLERIPAILHEPFFYYKNNRTYKDTHCAQKVSLSDIVGTTHQDYGDLKIIEAYMRLKRAPYHISEEHVTRNKYFHMLKKPVHNQKLPIKLSRLENGKCIIDGNGNHRIILYKIMMLSEIASKYPYANDDDYDLGCRIFNDIRKKYWLNALIHSTVYSSTT